MLKTILLISFLAIYTTANRQNDIISGLISPTEEDYKLLYEEF